MKLIKKSIFLLFIISSFITSESVSQDSIVFLNGKEIQVKVLEINAEGIRYEGLRGKKLIESYIDKDRVFAVVYESGITQFIYRPDSLVENPFSIREMKLFINGEQGALKNYKAPLITVGGVVVGALSGFFYNPFISPLVPVAYSVSIGLISPNLKRNIMFDQNFLKEEFYVLGYKRTASNKKILNGIKGSIAGFIIGITVRLIVSHHYSHHSN